MGSIAMDKRGNMALGYSVVNGVNVFPGIRYTGRRPGSATGTMPLGRRDHLQRNRRPDDDQLPLG